MRLCKRWRAARVAAGEYLCVEIYLQKLYFILCACFLHDFKGGLHTSRVWPKMVLKIKTDLYYAKLVRIS